MTFAELSESLLAQEASLRLGAFLGLLALFIAIETALPRRGRVFGRGVRWSVNGLLVLVDTAVLRLAFPVLAVGTAIWAGEHGLGLFNQGAVSPWIAFAASLLLLDLAIYCQHRIFHTVPLFWRLHRVHHTDRDVDVSTAVRFHPIEIALSMGIKMGVVIALGAPPLAVMVFEVMLNATSLFNHANISIPRGADRWIRRLIVTPDMHRIHHSVRMEETNSNYGFNLSLWDRVFGTYRAEPKDGHRHMALGLTEFADHRPLNPGFLLLLPVLPLPEPSKARNERRANS